MEWLAVACAVVLALMILTGLYTASKDIIRNLTNNKIPECPPKPIYKLTLSIDLVYQAPTRKKKSGYGLKRLSSDEIMKVIDEIKSYGWEQCTVIHREKDTVAFEFRDYGQGLPLPKVGEPGISDRWRVIGQSMILGRFRV